MSLTSQLDRKDSAISLFLARELPGLDAVRMDVRRQLPPDDTLRPVWPADGSGIPYSTLGHAIDLLLRLTLTPAAAPSVTAPGPVRAAIDGFLNDGLDPFERDPRTVSMLLGSFEETDPATSARRRALGSSCLQILETMTATVTSTVPHLAGFDPDSFEALARSAMVCAWLEETFRTGQVHPRSALDVLTSAGDPTPERILQQVPAAAVVDLQATIEHALACPGWAALVAQAREGAPVLSGPVFSGSRLVGGADADVIVNGTLIDIKATVQPRSLKRELFYQLIGYVLLDHDNQHQITAAGLFLPRQAALVSWPLEGLIGLFGASKPLTALRADCHEQLAAARAAQRSAAARSS